jgi:hypothetical protein
MIHRGNYFARPCASQAHAYTNPAARSYQTIVTLKLDQSSCFQTQSESLLEELLLLPPRLWLLCFFFLCPWLLPWLSAYKPPKPAEDPAYEEPWCDDPWCEEPWCEPWLPWLPCDLCFLCFFLSSFLRHVSETASSDHPTIAGTHLSLSMFAPIAPATRPPIVPKAPPPSLFPSIAPPAPPIRVEPRPRSPSAGPPGAPGWPYCGAPCCCGWP